MRKVIGTDIFAALRIVKAADLAEEVKALGLLVQRHERDDKPISVQEVGLEFLLRCMQKSTLAEEQLFAFFADIFEESVEDFKRKEIFDYGNYIAEFVQYFQGERAANFIKQLSGLMK